jgi:hypothetical protein
MRALMDRECRTLNEFLSTKRPVTRIRAFTGMNAPMSGEVRATREYLFAVFPRAFEPTLRYDTVTDTKEARVE